MNVSKEKYIKGKQIRSILEFDQSKCQCFKVKFGDDDIFQTRHRKFLTSWQYETLLNFITSGRVYEAEQVSSKEAQEPIELWPLTVEHLLNAYRNKVSLISIMKEHRHVATFYDMDEVKALYGQRHVAGFSTVVTSSPVNNDHFIIHLDEGELRTY